MKTIKDGRFLTTIPTITRCCLIKLRNTGVRDGQETVVNAIDNLKRLYMFKERDAINEEDFQELKEKLKKQI